MDRLPDRIQSRRLLLRTWTDDDLEAMSEAITASLDHLRPWMWWASSEPLGAAERLEFIRRGRIEWEAGGDVVLGIFRDGVVVGGTGLHRRRGADVLEIGYWIHVDHVRQGYATEVSEALTTVAFGVPGIERVEIHHDKANAASAGVPRRLGFRFDGETPDTVTAPAEVGIDCAWSTTRLAWLRTRR